MRRGLRRLAGATLIAAAVAAIGTPVGAAAAGGSGAYVLTATSPDGTYAPTYTGNGYLGIRVPPAGQGWHGGSVPANAELAGFYARPPGDVQQRANLPMWSTLGLVVGGARFSPDAGMVSGWRQRLDLHTGVITTTVRWTAPGGRVTDLRYDVFTDRARMHVGVVRLRLTPHWSGTARVVDVIDNGPSDLTSVVPGSPGRSRGQRWEAVRTQGARVVAGLASTVARPRGTAVFPVSAGKTYTVTKFVGVGDSNGSVRPLAAAKRDSSEAATAGYRRLLRENDRAWAALWRSRIDIVGNPRLATEVHASEFYLWASANAGVDWSISPAGLSSNGYDGHIFWDAETWMFPTLLAMHPELAKAMEEYRFQRLAAAKAHARATGFRGARFPWESAFDGTEQIPPPVSINSEGLYEQHITADIAIADWQYYLATGDRAWLARVAWPVISQAARFWAGRAHQGPDGRYHIDGVTGPDEENPDVNDEAFTNAAAAETLRDAASAAGVVGATAPPRWTRVAAGLVLLRDLVHPEFAGYRGQLVKQADVTLLQYPLQVLMPRSLAIRDLDYYAARSDPGGPSMTDAISAIDAAALGVPGCSADVYTRRSVEPFMRDPFDQFSETRTGGAFTFMTGIGGFLQEFLYGYSGLRWQRSAVELDPILAGGMRGVVLHRLAWHGRRFTVAIGPKGTRVTLDSGRPLPIAVGSATRLVRPGEPFALATRRPDLAPTNDVARCRDATATSAAPGADPIAAVDGSPVTDWQPARMPASLTVALGRERPVSRIVARWGRQWPEPPAPNVHPRPRPVIVLRPSSFTVAVSSDGRSWRQIARVSGHPARVTDILGFAATRARYVRVRVSNAGQRRALPQLAAVEVHGG
jgi:trehalose/maltose hydrolase-like predicted phosphorylase